MPHHSKPDLTDELKTQGTRLGAVICFLVWMWLTNVAILLGAEINAERERSQQLRDGTPGA